MTDYKEVAEMLAKYAHLGGVPKELNAAIDLCSRFANGELVERSEVWELARKVHFETSRPAPPAGSPCRVHTPPADTPDANEREHCERVIADEFRSPAQAHERHTLALMRERAAARVEKEAQCDAHMEAFRVLKRNYDALVAQEIGKAMDCAAHERAADQVGYERGRAEGRKAREDILRAHVEQQDKIEDMATQVREYRDRCDADISALQAKYDRVLAWAAERGYADNG